MNDVLKELMGLRRADAEERMARIPLARLEQRTLKSPQPRDFMAAFRRDGFNVIAELKKASPSEGLIRGDFHPIELACELESEGAAALSVLCEPHMFYGSELYLREARSVVSLPILYKDFISTRYQIAEARLSGADAVLLIAAALDDKTLKDLLSYAHSMMLTALVETHDEVEAARAVDAGAGMVGVNCRNLRNFTCDVSLLSRLIGKIPDACVRIAESGMHSFEALSEAKAAGADGFLVGTAIMRAKRPGAKLKELTGMGGVR